MGQPESMGETIYKIITRRNSVYVTLIMAGAIVGERVVSGFVDSCWESSNSGKFYEDIPTLGSKAEEAED